MMIVSLTGRSVVYTTKFCPSAFPACQHLHLAVQQPCRPQIRPGSSAKCARTNLPARISHQTVTHRFLRVCALAVQQPWRAAGHMLHPESKVIGQLSLHASGSKIARCDCFEHEQQAGQQPSLMCTHNCPCTSHHHFTPR